MKKITITTIVLMMILAATMISFAGNNAENVGVVVDGKIVEFDGAVPYIDTEAGRTMVPVRFVSEAMGVNVGWDGDEQMVALEKGKTIVQMIIGQKRYATKNQYGSVKETQMDVAPFIKKDAGRTIVPLRFVSEALGANVSWNGDTYTVHIDTEEEKESVYATEKEIEEFVENNIKGTEQYKADAKSVISESFVDYQKLKNVDFSDPNSGVEPKLLIAEIEGERKNGFTFVSGNNAHGNGFKFHLDFGWPDFDKESTKITFYMLEKMLGSESQIIIDQVNDFESWINTEGHRSGTLPSGVDYEIALDGYIGMAVRIHAWEQ